MKCSRCSFDNPSNSSFCGKCGTQIHKAQDNSNTQTINWKFREIHAGDILAGRYKIIQKLGSGGMGVVYKVEDTILRRIVALKILRPEYTLNTELKKRFIVEAQAAASVDHPNICTVFEISEAEGVDYITMPYIEGLTLDDRIRESRLDLKESLEIAEQIAEGLAEAHDKGVIHRDIKSANIMLTKKGQPKIMDFGLAKLMEYPGTTKTTKIIGTAAYMSPEQAKGEFVDFRADIWSLGVVIYEMLAGQLPFECESTPSLLYAIVHQQPKSLKKLDPSIPAEIVQVINKCLEKNPLKRYSSAGELVQALRAIKRNIPQNHKPTPGESFFSFRSLRSFPGLVIPIAIIFLILSIFFLPPAKKTIRHWIGSEPYAAPESLPEHDLAQPGDSRPAIVQIHMDEKTATINIGSDEEIRVGDTGFVLVRNGKQEDKADIKSYFMVKSVFPQQSQIEMTELDDDVQEGNMVQFDEKPRGLLMVSTNPKSADLFLENNHRGVTDATLVLDPGSYQIQIRAKNYSEISEVVQVDSGKRTEKQYQLVPIKASLGTLKIDSIPSGADVFLGNAKKASGKTPLELLLSPGRHQITVMKDDYEEVKFQNLTITSGDIVPVAANLKLRIGYLNIDTNPVGAKIYLGQNIVPEGETPFRAELRPGEYEIKMSKTGFEDIQALVRVDSGEQTKRSYELVPVKADSPAKKALVINTIPEEAQIFVNNVKIGTSPARYENDRERDIITLKIEKEGFRTIEEKIALDEPLKTVTREMRPVGMGKLRISAHPQAWVEIDGKALDKTVPPEYIMDIPEGEHKVLFSFEQDGIYEIPVSIKEGETAPIHFKVEDWMRERKAVYDISGYVPHESVRLKIDDRQIGDGKVPPAKKYRVDPGRHVLHFSLTDRGYRYADVQLIDHMDVIRTKQIHLSSEIAEMTDADMAEIPEAFLLTGDRDWISVHSQHPVRIEDDPARRNKPQFSEIHGFDKESQEFLQLKLNLQFPGRNNEIRIKIFKIKLRKIYIIKFTERIVSV